MSEAPGRRRVTVTGPPRPPRRHRPRAGGRDIDEQTPLGEVYMRSLLRTQLRLALATLALVLVPLGLIPVAVRIHPPLAELAVGRVPLSWLLLGAAVYPYLLAVGWRYVRQAERNERAFERIVSRR